MLSNAVNAREDASRNHSLKQEAELREINHFSEKTQVFKPPALLDEQNQEQD